MAYKQILSNGTEITLNLQAFDANKFPSSGGEYNVSTSSSGSYPTATDYYSGISRLYCNYGAGPGWYTVYSGDYQLMDFSEMQTEAEVYTFVFVVDLSGYTDISDWKIEGLFETWIDQYGTAGNTENAVLTRATRSLSRSDDITGQQLSFSASESGTQLRISGQATGVNIWGGLYTAFSVQKVTVYGRKK